jgi:hypothetical protein
MRAISSVITASGSRRTVDGSVEPMGDINHMRNHGHGSLGEIDREKDPAERHHRPGLGSSLMVSNQMQDIGWLMERRRYDSS